MDGATCSAVALDKRSPNVSDWKARLGVALTFCGAAMGPRSRGGGVALAAKPGGQAR